jgi:XTP/dITP diphosphohydrolase
LYSSYCTPGELCLANRQERQSGAGDLASAEWSGIVETIARGGQAEVKLLVATNNLGKIKEYERLMAELPVTVTFPEPEGLQMEVEETGETFEENARLKALAFAQASGTLSLADDSGLEVDALGGAPGVRSARYAGPSTTDEDRYQKLLAALTDVPEGQRTARFRCVIALAQPDGTVATADGTCEGSISTEPRGEHGFGYDPVFVVEGFRGRTMAELPPDIKNKISHRARAAEAVRPALLRILGAGHGPAAADTV